MYYSYHGQIKKKIKNGELIKYEYIDNYKNIGRVIMLYFKDGTKKFIREYRFIEYYSILKNKND
jgi:hypothetical protein